MDYCKPILRSPCLDPYLITLPIDQRMISPMISTIDIHNGFREDLLPMVFTCTSNASESLRHAILALSSFHLAGSREALTYKSQAIHYLQKSFNTAESPGLSETQLATSMMLCVYSVSQNPPCRYYYKLANAEEVFDETDGHWNLHLHGAQQILSELYQVATIRGKRLEYNFLFTWFLYHEVLGEFSRPLLYEGLRPASLRLLNDSNFDKSMVCLTPLLEPSNDDADYVKIIGSLGCSVEVMELVSYVNGLRADVLRGKMSTTTPEEQARRQEDWHRVENQIATLTQRLDPRAAVQLSMSEQVRIRTTAELYRIATFLYLQRTCNTADAEQLRIIYMEQAFKALHSLEICTSPWPLFVVACETETDEQRIEILQILDRMDDTRNIGNILVLRNIIETFWKRKDLQADVGRSNDLKWWDVLDLQTTAPWFI